MVHIEVPFVAESRNNTVYLPNYIYFSLRGGKCPESGLVAEGKCFLASTLLISAFRTVQIRESDEPLVEVWKQARV